MSAYLIVQANIKNKTLYEEFINKILPKYKEYNAKVLVADNDPKLLEGEGEYQRAVIVEFENSDVLKAWFNSLQDEGFLKLRRAAADSTIIYVDGVNRL